MNSQIVISFASKTQTPALLIIKEEYENNAVSFASIIYKEDLFESFVVIREKVQNVKEYRVERDICVNYPLEKE